MTGRLGLSAKHVRDGAVIIVITALLFVAIELTLKIFWPQLLPERTYLHGTSLMIPDKTQGWVNRPNADVVVQNQEYRVEYKINAQGLRDETPHSPGVGPGCIRILLLGNSFTFGEGNDYAKEWPVLLESLLKQSGYAVDVVKAGVEGYNTRQEVQYLQMLVAEYHPSLVLIAFLPNDLFTNTPFDAPVPDPSSVNDVAIGSSAQDTAGSHAAETPRGRLERLVRSVSHVLNSVALARRVMFASDFLYLRLCLATPRAQYFTNPPSQVLSSQLKLTQTLLRAGFDYCAARGVGFGVVSIPLEFQVIEGARDAHLKGIDAGIVDSVMAKFAATEGFPWMVALPAVTQAYESSATPLYFRVDGHLNNAGNALVARFLAQRLVALHLLSTKQTASRPRLRG